MVLFTVKKGKIQARGWVRNGRYVSAYLWTYVHLTRESHERAAAVGNLILN